MKYLYFMDGGFAALQSGGVCPTGAITVSDEEASQISAALLSGHRITEVDGGWAVSKTTVDPLEKERGSMVCSRLQGRLTLGKETCDQLDAIANDPTTPWAMTQTILHAGVWERTSQSMDELAYLLGYEPLQMDDLFRFAMTLKV